jgi:uncharacterized membrane protein YdjX (TVP38/TMEM64 family)
MSAPISILLVIAFERIEFAMGSRHGIRSQKGAMATLRRPRSRSSTASRRSPARSTKSKGWRGWLRQNWRTLTTIAVVAIGLSVAWGRIDIDQVHRQARHVPAVWAFLLMVLLPLLGCPATIVNLGAGIRFGVAGGLPLVAAAIVLHQVIAFFLVRWNPDMFGHLVDPIRQRLPKGSHSAVAVFSALLPGVPYWMQVYSMPLIGVPLKTILLCCAPLHTMRSLIALVGGGVSGHLTKGWLIGLGTYSLVLMSVCAYAGRRIRTHLARGHRRRRSRAADAKSNPETPATAFRAVTVGGGK